MGGDPNQPLENSAFPEEGSPGNGNIGDMQVIAVEGKGEVKRGGEDGRSNSGAPHRERRGGENEEFSNVRRGRGVYCFLFSLSLFINCSKTGKNGKVSGRKDIKTIHLQRECYKLSLHNILPIFLYSSFSLLTLQGIVVCF